MFKDNNSEATKMQSTNAVRDSEYMENSSTENSKREERVYRPSRSKLTEASQNQIFKAESLNISSSVKLAKKTESPTSLVHCDSSVLKPETHHGLVLTADAGGFMNYCPNKPENVSNTSHNSNSNDYDLSEETLSFKEINNKKDISKSKNMLKQNINKSKNTCRTKEETDLKPTKNLNFKPLEESGVSKSRIQNENKKERELKSESKKKILEKQKRKYTRSKDIEASEQKYCCNVCGRKYISYPAFYTHKRNRHNIISITNRHNLFQSEGSQGPNFKYNYNSIGYGKIINFDFSEMLIETMKKTLATIFQSEDSLFYVNEKQTGTEARDLVANHAFIEYLLKYKFAFANKIFIPNADLNLPIDEILVVYFILFSKVINEKKLIELAAAFIVYFREYLNLHGFDYYQAFMKFDLFEIPGKKLFSENAYVQYLPDLTEDFIASFLTIPGIALEIDKFGEMQSLCKNLCNWLFVNDLSSLKLIIPEKKLKF